jgi:hypothetical protein
MNGTLISDFVVSGNGFGFRSDTGHVYQLNSTAREIIGWLREGRDETQILQQLSQQHDVPLHRVRQDVAGFFEHLETLHLLDSKK